MCNKMAPFSVYYTEKAENWDFLNNPPILASKSFPSHLLKFENCILSCHQPDTQFANKVEISYQSVVLNAWHVPLCIHILNDSLSSLESHILSLKEELAIYSFWRRWCIFNRFVLEHKMSSFRKITLSKFLFVE